MPRYVSWTIERKGGTIGDVVVAFQCSYFFSGIAFLASLLTDQEQQVVISDGASLASVSVFISNSTFLNVGGIFEIQIEEVRLVTGKSIMYNTYMYMYVLYMYMYVIMSIYTCIYHIYSITRVLYHQYIA